MRSLERHRDVGAYTLGVLDEADAFRFEDHLTGCPGCAVRLSELRFHARQLMLYRRATPRVVHPVAGPGPRLLDRLLGEVAARRRAGRRRLLCAVAASAVLAVAVPAVAVMAQGGGRAHRISATDERSGVWARVTAEDQAWGSRVRLDVRDAAGPRVCHLVAVGRDGSEQTVTTWTAPRHDARLRTTHGGAALRPAQIDRWEVRTATGERLVTLDPR